MKPSESVGVSPVSPHLLVEWRYSEGAVFPRVPRPAPRPNAPSAERC